MSRNEPIPRWKEALRNAATGLVLGGVALGAAGCTPAEKPPATAAATAEPGEKTPDVSASPDANQDLDVFHSDINALKGKSIQEIYPAMPNEFTAEYIDAHPKEIPELFAIGADEASTPKDAMKAWFIRDISMHNFGSSKAMMDKSADGSGEMLPVIKERFLDAWRALNGYGDKATPAPSVLNKQDAASQAFEFTAVARSADHPAFMPIVATIPDLENMVVTEHDDGSYDVTVPVHTFFAADSKEIDKMGIGVTFKETDEVGSLTFTNCSTKTGQFLYEKLSGK